jgi:hypothetical protein
MTLDLNIQIQPEFANCYVYQPFPGTELQQYSIEQNFMDHSIVNNLGLSFYDRYWQSNKELNRIINVQRILGLAVKFPKLRGPLVYLARNNWRLTVDVIFGFYYLWWLAFYYKLTPAQIIDLIVVWIKSRLDSSDPASESIKQGEGQLYPQVNKI